MVDLPATFYFFDEITSWRACHIDVDTADNSRDFWLIDWLVDWLFVFAQVFDIHSF